MHRHKAMWCFRSSFRARRKALVCDCWDYQPRSIAVRQSILCQCQMLNPAEHTRSASGCGPEGCRLFVLPKVPCVPYTFPCMPYQLRVDSESTWPRVKLGFRGGTPSHIALDTPGRNVRTRSSLFTTSLIVKFWKFTKVNFESSQKWTLEVHTKWTSQ